MRILMTALQPGGGIRTFFRYVYSQTCFQDCYFVLVAPDNGLADFLAQHISVERLTVIPADPGNLQFLLQIKGLLKSGDFELVHSHGFAAGNLTEVARGRIAVPHLMTAHDVFLETQFTGWKGLLKRQLMSRIFRRMTGIHTVTEDAGENVLAFFPEIDRSNVHRILHGVDTEYFKYGAPRDLHKELGLSRRTPLIGFFGRFMGQKGFRTLVDALNEVVEKDWMSPVPHVVTFGWGGFIREDYAYLKDKGLGDFFHQLEQTNDMSGSVKGVNVVAMPSRWEACGLLAMECLAAGVPIVGSNCIGLREVLEGSPARQVPVGDAKALALALMGEIRDVENRRLAFQEYQSEAVDRFGIERPAARLRDLYNDLLPYDASGS